MRNQANAYVTTLEVLLKDDQLKLHQYLLQLHDSLQKVLLKSKEVLIERKKTVSQVRQIHQQTGGGARIPTRPPPPAGELDKPDPDHPGTLNRDPRKAAWTQTARTRTVRTHTARTPTVGTQTVVMRKTGTHTTTQDTAM